MRRLKFIIVMAFAVGAVLFATKYIFAQSARKVQLDAPVQSTLNTFSESQPVIDCVMQRGYCLKKGIVIEGMTLKAK